MSDDDIAISDLTNRIDVGQHKVTDLSEQVAQAQADNERLTAQLKELGQSPNAAAPDRSAAAARRSTASSARPARSTASPTPRSPSARPSRSRRAWSSTSIDRTTGQFLGELTIDNVDLHEATGRLEGPAVHDVRVGTDVRTQL